MFGKNIESAIFTNFFNRYFQQLHLFATTPALSSGCDVNNPEDLELEITAIDKFKQMTATVKFKSVWSTLFAAQNSCIVTKSMKAHSTTDTDSNHSNSQLSSSSSSEYVKRRQKNNESVRKSRAKNRSKLQECGTHVSELRSENVKLTRTLDTLEGELGTLKSLFQHCFSFDLNHMAIKPAEIPTSTLYKMIMKKEMDAGVVSTTTASSMKDISFMHTPPHDNKESASEVSSAQASPKSITTEEFSDTDKFYINQIKTALSNLVVAHSPPQMNIRRSVAN